MALRKKRNFKGLALPSQDIQSIQPPETQTVTKKQPNKETTLKRRGCDFNVLLRDNRNEPDNSDIYTNYLNNYTGNNQNNNQYANNERLGKFEIVINPDDLEILRDLGSGASGAVSKVLHKSSNTVMAMKVVRIDASIRQQVLKELQILYECNSPYIVSFYGAFPQGNTIKICLEYMDLGSFDSIYRKSGAIPTNVLGLLTHSVLQGLTYLYNTHRIMHRDIKPSNILINSSGYIKICDFGISKEMVNSIANTFVGTASYMSPERMQGSSYTVKSDVWSLGTTLMELALGYYPFRPEGENMSIFEMLDYIANEKLPSLPVDRFLRDFVEFVDLCLIKDPEGRPTPVMLIDHPFVLRYSRRRVDISGWLKSIEHS
ncbi:hypothetical protein BB558_007636 [Smittium angustum]|uniref:Protein kinase domain-containing protein n=1 Tax=Smittium angustum TaxID=133377 RepID=A0A2U1IUJ4_SMIAN|nr:hypothetical protein BB558_007636 [Smittium angustum]